MTNNQLIVRRMNQMQDAQKAGRPGQPNRVAVEQRFKVLGIPSPWANRK
ncbi:MAG: hypothetical protein V4436_02715 [Patescibacteria group bacterium]